MCTALTLKTSNNHQLFGRNMDLEYTFGQMPLFLPRNYTATNSETGFINTNKYAILGMGVIFNNFPTYADVMNEKGLACAGLNFPNNAKFPKQDELDLTKTCVPNYNFLLWVVSNFKNVCEVKEALKNVIITSEAISKHAPPAPLHYIITDKIGECIVVEQTEINSKIVLNVYDNKVGVLTNNPDFNWHMTNLSQHINLSFKQVEQLELEDFTVNALGQGTSLLGLVGDFTPASRFVRSVLLRDAVIKNAKNINIMQIFHIFNNVAMVDGSVITPQGKNDITLYSSCMDLTEGVYYYNTYNNSQLNAISFKNQDLDAKELKAFEYIDKLSINYQN